MVNLKNEQVETSKVNFLESSLEDRLLACQLVSEVRKSPGHISFTLTDVGIMQFAKAMQTAFLEDALSMDNNHSNNIFPGKDEALVSKKDVILGLNVTSTTLWKWEKSGYLVPVRVGKKIYYKREDLQNLTKK